MNVIAGLGNPGREYERTPHNVGFAVVDRLAADVRCQFRRSLRFRAMVGRASIGGRDSLLVKPQTYMNCSGEAVAGILRWHKSGAGDLVIVVDDADLPLGRIRVRAKGSSGGHRGIESVIRCLGSNAFARVRVGVGRDERRGSLVGHVLTPFSSEEAERMEPAVAAAADAVSCVLERGVDAAMNRFNS